MSDQYPTPNPGPPQQPPAGTPVPAQPYPDQNQAGTYSQHSYTEARLPNGAYPEVQQGSTDPAIAGYTTAGYSVRAGQPVMRPKSPGLALVASFFIPGLGSMINGDVGKGLFILFGYIISWALVIVILGVFGVFGFWVYGMVDAYTGAKMWNARHGLYM